MWPKIRRPKHAAGERENTYQKQGINDGIHNPDGTAENVLRHEFQRTNHCRTREFESIAGRIEQTHER